MGLIFSRFHRSHRSTRSNKFDTSYKGTKRRKPANSKESRLSHTHTHTHKPLIQVSHPYPLAPRALTPKPKPIPPAGGPLQCSPSSPPPLSLSPMTPLSPLSPLSPLAPHTPTHNSPRAATHSPTSFRSYLKSSSSSSPASISRIGKLRKPLRVEGDWDLWTPGDLDGYSSDPAAGIGRITSLEAVLASGEVVIIGRDHPASSSSSLSETSAQERRSPSLDSRMSSHPEIENAQGREGGREEGEDPKTESTATLITGLSNHWEVVAWLTANRSSLSASDVEVHVARTMGEGSA